MALQMISVALLLLIMLPILEGREAARGTKPTFIKLLPLLKLPGLVMGFILLSRAQIVPAYSINIPVWSQHPVVFSWQASTTLTFYDILLVLCVYMLEVVSMLYALRRVRLQPG